MIRNYPKNFACQNAKTNCKPNLGAKKLKLHFFSNFFPTVQSFKTISFREKEFMEFSIKKKSRRFEKSRDRIDTKTSIFECVHTRLLLPYFRPSFILENEVVRRCIFRIPTLRCCLCSAFAFLLFLLL